MSSLQNVRVANWDSYKKNHAEPIYFFINIIFSRCKLVLVTIVFSTLNKMNIFKTLVREIEIS